MKRKNLQFESGFRVILGIVFPSRGDGAAARGCGRRSGKPPSGTDQWLYVVSGTGTATVNGKRYRLGEGTLMLIEQGDEHEIAIMERI